MISIIIPTYARPEQAVAAIRSAKRQSYKDIEIIVIDDNGQGTEYQKETEKRVKALQCETVRYIPHVINMGGCAARNTGIKNAKGEFVAFLDDDDIWSERFLENLIRCFEKPTVGAAYCDFYSYDGHYSRTLVKRIVYEGNVYQEILKGWCPASTSLFVVRRSSIMDVGMFDEGLPSFQDYDMWLNLSSKYEFVYCREKLVLKYEGFGEQTSRNPVRRLNGYNQVVEKWSNKLSEDDLVLFQSFRKKYYYDTLYRRIVYNKKHGNEYKNELKEYYEAFPSKSHRLHVWLRLNMNERLYAELGTFLSRFDKGVVCYKGEYPV